MTVRAHHRIDPAPVAMPYGMSNVYFCAAKGCHRDLERTPSGYRHLDSQGAYRRFLRSRDKGATIRRRRKLTTMPAAKR